MNNIGGIKIAIVDTGICKDHPHLNKSVYNGYSFVGKDCTDYQDQNGHGTLCTSVIKKECSSAQFYIIKALDHTSISKLSGGQKQRIAIARALLEKSSIIIFDEATSALDNISQKEIMSNISGYISCKTVIIIAHRLSTIENADQIYVLSHGNVIQKGRHLDLLNQDGKYHELVKQVQ